MDEITCQVVDKISPVLCTKKIHGTKTEKHGRDGDKVVACNELHPALADSIFKKRKFSCTGKIDGSGAIILPDPKDPVTGFPKLYRRRDLKPGRKRPDTFLPIEKKVHEDDVVIAAIEKKKHENEEKENAKYLEENPKPNTKPNAKPISKTKGGNAKEGNAKEGNAKVAKTETETEPNTESVENQQNAHYIGFLPLDPNDNDCKWFYEAHPLDTEGKRDLTKITVLVPVPEAPGSRIMHMEYMDVDIRTLVNRSVELVGPKVGNNMHGLQRHCVIPHGSIMLPSFPDLARYLAITEAGDFVIGTKPGLLAAINKWFIDDPMAPYMEGVVVHVENHHLYKLTRHHLDMPWDRNLKVPPLDQLVFTV